MPHSLDHIAENKIGIAALAVLPSCTVEREYGSSRTRSVHRRETILGLLAIVRVADGLPEMTETRAVSGEIDGFYS